jgi:hypothetical protein
MKVYVAYKAVTYELLTDRDFIKTARNKILSFYFLYEEFEAARASKPGRSKRLLNNSQFMKNCCVRCAHALRASVLHGM